MLWLPLLLGSCFEGCGSLCSGEPLHVGMSLLEVGMYLSCFGMILSCFDMVLQLHVGKWFAAGVFFCSASFAQNPKRTDRTRHHVGMFSGMLLRMFALLGCLELAAAAPFGTSCFHDFSLNGYGRTGFCRRVHPGEVANEEAPSLRTPDFSSPSGFGPAAQIAVPRPPAASHQDVPAASDQNVPAAYDQNVPAASDQDVPAASDQVATVALIQDATGAVPDLASPAETEDLDSWGPQWPGDGPSSKKSRVSPGIPQQGIPSDVAAGSVALPALKWAGPTRSRGRRASAPLVTLLRSSSRGTNVRQCGNAGGSRLLAEDFVVSWLAMLGLEVLTAPLVRRGFPFPARWPKRRLRFDRFPQHLSRNLRRCRRWRSRWASTSRPRRTRIKIVGTSGFIGA